MPLITKKFSTEINVEEFHINEDFCHVIARPSNDVPEHLSINYNTAGFDNVVLTNAQSAAASCIREGYSTIFAAPSSSGKTAMAIWAIRHAIREKIPFLCVVRDDSSAENVEHRLIRAYCHDVASLNINSEPKPNSIVTIPALQKYLQYEQPFIGQIKFFIFDDLDLLHDKDVGHALELCLAQLPPNSQLFIASTNFDDTDRFLSWLSNHYGKEHHLILADKRPFKFDFHLSVPRDMANIEIFPMATPSDEFSIQSENFQTAMQSMIRLRDTAEIRRFAQRSKTAALVRLTVRKLFLAREKILPFVVVALSNELAEFYGWEIGLGLDLLGPKAKLKISELMRTFYPSVDEESKDFMLLHKLTDIFLNGVAFLHAGLPKIVREFVEALYFRELIRVLVITEQMVINSPFRGRTVIIPSSRKFDGTRSRYLTNYEWQKLVCLVQIPPSLHEVTRVVLIMDWKVDYNTLAEIVLPKNVGLYSKELHDIDATQEFQGRPFFSFLQQRRAVDAKKAVQDMKAMLEQSSDFKNKEVLNYTKLKSRYEQLSSEYDAKAFTTQNIIPYLNAGRLITVVDGDKDFGLAMVIKYEPQSKMTPEALFVAMKLSRDSLVFKRGEDTLVHHHDFSRLVPAHPDEEGPSVNESISVVQIVKIPVDKVRTVYTYRLKMPTNLKDEKGFNFLATLLNGVVTYTHGEFEKVKVNELDLDEIRDELTSIEKQLAENDQHYKSNEFLEQLSQYESMEKTRKEIKKLEEFIAENAQTE